ncbi:transcriptional regulator [Sphingosinicella sp. BN140058]|uniref:transcriptional regulator n=1 Tax=Sphingosinicella sp. BN140058 TaxID=1892855 RepID=UPI001010C2B6|nr:transcriptional regulator [Sphingosinicella sp. BN140058]QAY77607.1 ArsR family transcriptional regulator [Sphingosinicella sp. BN140058]
MSADGLDPVIHAPARLQLSALLAGVDEMEFASARETIEVSDSVLSKHLAQMQEAGYVRLRKAALGGRQRTWLSLTAQGRAALERHLRALEKIAALARR